MNLLLVSALLHSAPAPSPADAPQSFALIIGVNDSGEPGVAPLAYADDNALEFARLFERLGAQTLLLAKADESTRRLNSDRPTPNGPTRAGVADAVAKIAEQVRSAKRSGKRARFYFVYAGYGSIDEHHRGSVSLLGDRLSAKAIADEIVARVDADETHVVIDACHSSFLADAAVRSRGRGASSKSHGPRVIPSEGPVGLLLSTSASEESHEWKGFQAGVFSYEVRAGLYGAADADGDGDVSYREMAAFIAQANAAVPNLRFRPRVTVRPPEKTDVLASMDRGGPAVVIDGTLHGQFVLQDQSGVRIAQFHSAVGQRTRLLLSGERSPLFLRRVGKRSEYVLNSKQADLDLSSIEPSTPRSPGSEPAHHLFSQIFALPFSTHSVQRLGRSDRLASPPPPPAPSVSTLTILGWTGVGTAAALAAAGVLVNLDAADIRDDANEGTERDRLRVEDRVAIRERNAAILYGGAAVAAGVGLTLLLLAPESGGLAIAPSTDGSAVFLSAGGRY